VELVPHDPTYEDMVIKFAEHFLYRRGMNKPDQMWDEEDGFYYDRCGSRTAVPSGSRSAQW
jgi:hypothetical protein